MKFYVFIILYYIIDSRPFLYNVYKQRKGWIMESSSITLSLILSLCALLIQSGDIELNPGPVTGKEVVLLK